ncbi:MAG: DUF1549 and DUF1553 domain-containing protein, partial [Rubripirellula sp.]
QWIEMGAQGTEEDMGETEFSRLGDQRFLFGKAKSHWAFQPVIAVPPPSVKASTHRAWSRDPIDRFVFAELAKSELTPSRRTDPRTLARRLHGDLTGLPPSFQQIEDFAVEATVDFDLATNRLIQRLIDSPEYGQHIARMWLDVARYGDTDNAYRPDTKTPHYMPFAFTYRDYVVEAFNRDLRYDEFIKEQIAADLMGHPSGTDPTAALGFLAAGPHANRAPAEALDDWIDLTTRGLMGLTVACARCHDHKFEPIPTTDYYSLRAVFASITRVNALDEKRQPLLTSYTPTDRQQNAYQVKRAEIEQKIEDAAGKKARGNNRSVSQKIRETELAELLSFHPGAPARAMLVTDKPKQPPAYVFIRGDARARGDEVSRRFLTILDPDLQDFSRTNSGRLDLANRIASTENPLTARVFVNRVWGQLMGSYLVATPSDFGLQGSPPTHPELLDWLTNDFVTHDWSIKHLVRSIVHSQTYQQSSQHRDTAAETDPENRLLWRANRKHMSIEAIRDRMLAVSGQLDSRVRGRPEKLWGENYTRRRAIYGFINRFNLDPTLRAFDFPAPIQTQPNRGESIVAPQALFLLNSPVVVDQAQHIVESYSFAQCETDEQRVEHIFRTVLGRDPVHNEIGRSLRMVEYQSRFKKPARPGRFVLSPWPLIAQALIMSNEFQYID